MIRTDVGGLTYYEFETFPSERVRHGIFTRLGGVSRPPFATLNLSSSVPDDPHAVAENRRRFYSVMETDPNSAVRTIQVHGAKVTAVDFNDLSTVQQGTDGLITRQSDLSLVMAFADCVPVMLFDPVRSVVGIAHAGWRGLVLGVCQAAIGRMVSAYGCQPTDIRAGIGPSIGVCCYEVGIEVVEAFRDSFGKDRGLYRENSRGSYHLDLSAASQVALREAGVTQIETANICTACRVDEFFSHRREAGRTGRFGAIIALRRSSGEGK